VTARPKGGRFVSTWAIVCQAAPWGIGQSWLPNPCAMPEPRSQNGALRAMLEHLACLPKAHLIPPSPSFKALSRLNRNFFCNARGRGPAHFPVSESASPRTGRRAAGMDDRGRMLVGGRRKGGACFKGRFLCMRIAHVYELPCSPAGKTFRGSREDPFHGRVPDGPGEANRDNLKNIGPESGGKGEPFFRTFAASGRRVKAQRRFS
jgi:hypothetical protein